MLWRTSALHSIWRQGTPNVLAICRGTPTRLTRRRRPVSLAAPDRTMTSYGAACIICTAATDAFHFLAGTRFLRFRSCLFAATSYRLGARNFFGQAILRLGLLRLVRSIYWLTTQARQSDRESNKSSTLSKSYSEINECILLMTRHEASSAVDCASALRPK